MSRSLQEISNNKTKSELRKEASDFLRKYPHLVFSQGGESFTPRQVQRLGHRDNLIEHISKWEQQISDNNTSIEPTPVAHFDAEPPKALTVEKVEESFEQFLETAGEEPVESTEDINEEPVEESDAEAEKLSIAKKLYHSDGKDNSLIGLKKYHENWWMENKIASNRAFGEMASLVATARIIIEKYAEANATGDKPAASSLVDIKNQITKLIREFVEIDNEAFDERHGRTLIDSFETFESSLRLAFKEYSQQKYRAQQEKNDLAEQDVRRVQVGDFVEWAVHTINNLHSLKSSQWKEVAIALMLLTGRRQSEVMSSGIFTFVDAGHLTFDGQLKRHAEEEEEVITIPVIGNQAQQVLNSIAWLESHGKRSIPENRSQQGLQKAAAKSHTRCARYVSEAMAARKGLVTIAQGAQTDWNDVKGRNIFKGHLTRQIYAQICSELFVPLTQKKQSYIAHILNENRAAAVCYDRDLTVVDFDRIKQLCGLE